MTSLSEISAALDSLLDLAAFSDDVSNNGIQVQGASAGVTKLCAGVDATPEFFEEARKRGAQMVLVHHGISWGASLARIAGRNYDFVAPLIKNDMALYAAHLPVDAHLTLGNNAQLAAAVGLTSWEPFFDYHGLTIGVKGTFATPIAWSDFCERLRAACPDGRFEQVDAGKKEIRTVGIVSGGAADGWEQAAAAGLDAYVSGEMNLVAYHGARGAHINMVAAGHYATERFGVTAVGRHIAAQFGLEFEFVDFHIKF